MVGLLVPGPYRIIFLHRLSCKKHDEPETLKTIILFYYRAVAKYLQTIFDKEAENGKSVVVADKLLAGKTRKEASRMFFETLVCS